MLLHGYHGETRGPVPASGFAGPEVFLAYTADLAAAYADGAVLTVAYESTRPLVLADAAAFMAAWGASGADALDGPFHPTCTHAFAEWARAQGYDAIVVPPEALDDEAGYDAIGGRLGDAQMILLVPERARIGGRA